MGGDGGDGGDGSDGSVGANDGGVSDASGSSDSSSVSTSDFGGFGDNASAADAAAAAAAQGVPGGLDGVSSTGIGAFGPSDATPGNDPANTPGFGAFADASLGPGIGYGDIGGFGVPGVGNGISGFGGFGGYGSAGPGSPGGFGNTGVATANESEQGVAVSMGLNINDALGISPAQVSALGNLTDAPFGNPNFGMPANTPAVAATPAAPAVAANNFGNLSSEFGNFSTNAYGQSQSIPSESAAVAAISNAINDAIGPQATPTAPPSAPPSEAELGVADWGALNSVDTNAANNNIGFSTTADSLAAQANQAAHAALNNAQQSQPNFSTVADPVFGSFTVAAPGVSVAQSDPNNPDATYGYTDEALGHFSNPTNEPTTTTSQSLNVPGVNLGLQGFSPSPPGVVGVAPSMGYGYGLNGFGIPAPAPAVAAAPVAVAQAPAVTSPAVTAPAIAAAPAVAAVAPQGTLGTGVTAANIGQNINSMDAGSNLNAIMIARYPWLAFQAA